MCCQPPLDIATMDHVRVSIIRTAWILIGKLVKTKVPESHEYTMNLFVCKKVEDNTLQLFLTLSNFRFAKHKIFFC